MKILMFIIMFLVIGALFIISENSISLRDEEGRNEFSQLYLSWFSQIFENSKSIVGYVVKLDWLPEN